ncbi:hypothetical protein [Larkinella sp.]|uniref:hypothetical protein n=1 Tax=Larkinella sp. TaxID=2034517 RepID=UPI003BAB2DA3
MKTAIKHTLAVIALFASTLVVQAQVKIGTNPTVAAPTSNLEVEASTPNRKVKVDKTTGQLTIQDGTEGTGKVLTSDAVGGASWQSVSLTIFAGTTTQARQNMYSSVGPSNYQNVTFQAETADPTNSFDPPTGTFTAPSTGFYQVFGSTQFDNNAIGASVFNAACLRLVVNGGTIVGQACSQMNVVTFSASVSNIVFLNAGDTINLTAAATPATGSIFGIVVSSFYAYKIAN